MKSHFACIKCKSKGFNFNYFLSIEEDIKYYRTPDPINQNNNHNNSNSNKNVLGKVINITFVKNGKKYDFSFFEGDRMVDQIEEIKKKINVGPNSTYYYKGDNIDINKSLKENDLFNGAEIEISDN